jgi:ABC-type phosphate transport system substrate-binding protein
MRNGAQVLSAAATFLGLLGLATSIGSATASMRPIKPQEAAILGSGSTWASNAIEKWIANIAPQGVPVVYNPVGSATGRSDYINDAVSFAVSDVPFRNGQDKLGGTSAETVPWGYSYFPALAGGTAFMYHLNVHGRLITNLRLSGKTIMKIFTGQITNWDNAEIAHEYGTKLPNIPIIPVIHSGGEGSTYYFTRWMAREYGRQWNAFCDRVHPGIAPPCGPTEFYPQFGRAQAETGSPAVANDIVATNGSIGYDEYSYPLQAGYPVVRLRNAAGRYVLPTPAHVTLALTRAVINENPNSPSFLEENLNKVYTYKNPKSYPLSNYSYLIAPRIGTTLPPNFTDAKGLTLSQFVFYDLCAGQHYVAILGYAPLPANLVRAGLKQESSIPGHMPIPPMSECRIAR